MKDRMSTIERSSARANAFRRCNIASDGLHLVGRPVAVDVERFQCASRRARASFPDGLPQLGGGHVYIEKLSLALPARFPIRSSWNQS